MNIRKAGVIGAGSMGSGITQKIAQEGIEVVMIDTEDRFVKKGMDSIRKTLAEGVERKIFTNEKKDEILKRISGTTDKGKVKDADIIIEAIFEDFEVKKRLLKELDEICEEKTVLASNTSSFSISELADAVKRKDRFLGLHFFYHPAKNRLLEVIPGRDTSQKTLAIGNAFCHIIGKTAISVKDAPGFAVNRFFVPWLNEATRILDEGIANIPTIDDTAKRVFGIGMGPFQLMNVTGIPIAYHSTVSLKNALGEFYAPSNCLKRQFEKHEPWDMSGAIDASKANAVEERLLGAVFTVACSLVEEGVSSKEDTDRGAKIGLRWNLGPFEMMNAYGTDRSYGIVARFIKKFPSLAMPKNLKNIYDCKETWSFNLVDLHINKAIARVVINRPEAMNAINEDVVSQLDKQFTKAENTLGIKAIVLEGSGKAFIAGADIQYFVRKIKEGKIDDIVKFTTYGHAVLKKIDNSKKLVIAKLDGLALGGGVEIALAADTIIASEKGSIGFPETGIGIYPGLGGTQRTTRYIGKELAKYLVFTGKTLDAGSAKAFGLVEYVVPSEEIDNKITELVNSNNILVKHKKVGVDLSADLQKIKEYFNDANIQHMLSGKGDLDEQGKKISKSISYKAPIAIQLANKLIDDGSRVNLNDGLQLELDNLKKVFATRDALEGLSSVLERRRPVFKGE